MTQPDNNSISYLAGRLAAKFGKWTAVVALVGIGVPMLIFSVVENRNAEAAREAERQKVVAQSAAKRLEIARQLAEQQRTCTEGISTLLSQGREALRLNDPKRALAIAETCNGVPASTAALQSLTATAQQAIKAKEARELRELQAVAEKEKRDDLARRKSQGVRIGMTREDVVLSSWGRPTRINRTTSARGEREQWVYNLRSYLYFEDGVLVTIQN